MAELELLKKIALDIQHVKIDVEELRELMYPPEEKISHKLIKSVEESEKSYKEGKFKEAKNSEEIKQIFR